MHICKAKQYSDQMKCECGNEWDMNDPCPPQCKKRKPFWRYVFIAANVIYWVAAWWIFA